jgi:hypothetical protein
MMFGLVTPSRHFGPGRAPVFREEHYRPHLRSEERSQYLLQMALSSANGYDLYQRFDVVGSDTRARYRIRRNQTPNHRIEHSIVLLRPPTRSPRQRCIGELEIGRLTV